MSKSQPKKSPAKKSAKASPGKSIAKTTGLSGRITRKGYVSGIYTTPRGGEFALAGTLPVTAPRAPVQFPWAYAIEVRFNRESYDLAQVARILGSLDRLFLASCRLNGFPYDRPEVRVRSGSLLVLLASNAEHVIAGLGMVGLWLSRDTLPKALDTPGRIRVQRAKTELELRRIEKELETLEKEGGPYEVNVIEGDLVSETPPTLRAPKKTPPKKLPSKRAPKKTPKKKRD
ncbi:MAG: hypothetical protein JWP14_2660 [Frankiales bacterium]|nr:hypothetical protein [Frankiales bacterium]